MTTNNTVKWIDVFPDLIYNYNHTVHSSIDMEPADVSKRTEQKILNDALKRYQELKGKNKMLKEGDVVRIPNKKGKFEKEGTTYSSEIYTIESIGGTKVSVRNSKGNLLKTQYPINQVLKVPKNSVEQNVEEIKQAKKESKIKRMVNREGLEVNNDQQNKRTSAPRRSKLKGYERLFNQSNL